MLIVWFLSIKSSPSLLLGCSASQEIRVTRFAQPTINPLARCICWAGSLGHAVFPPWNEGPNLGSYITTRQLQPSYFQTPPSQMFHSSHGRRSTRFPHGPALDSFSLGSRVECLEAWILEPKDLGPFLSVFPLRSVTLEKLLLCAYS